MPVELMHLEDVWLIMFWFCGIFYKTIVSVNYEMCVILSLQLLDLQGHEKEWILEHFGHSYNIHMEFYRANMPILEMTKMARLLSVIDKKAVLSLAGKKLQDLDIEGKLSFWAKSCKLVMFTFGFFQKLCWGEGFLGKILYKLLLLCQQTVQNISLKGLCIARWNFILPKSQAEGNVTFFRSMHNHEGAVIWSVSR